MKEKEKIKEKSMSKQKKITKNNKNTKKQDARVDNRTQNSHKGLLKRKQEKKSMVTYVLLWIVFVFLLGLVVGLGVLIYQKKKTQDVQPVANISIPILKTDSRFSFNINAFNLASSDEYVFRVSNYKGDKLVENLTYNITIKNPTDSIIKLTKDGSKKDLMIDQANTILDNQKFLSSTKEDVYYHVSIIIKGEKVTEKDLISVIITS